MSYYTLRSGTTTKGLHEATIANVTFKKINYHGHEVDAIRLDVILDDGYSTGDVIPLHPTMDWKLRHLAAALNLQLPYNMGDVANVAVGAHVLVEMQEGKTGRGHKIMRVRKYFKGGDGYAVG